MRRNEEFLAALEELKPEVEGTVRVASIYSVGLVEMTQLEAEFQKRQPSVRLAVDYLRPEKVYDAVLSDRSDIGLVSYPEPTREIQVTSWRNEEMVVAVPPSQLAGRNLWGRAICTGWSLSLSTMSCRSGGKWTGI